MSLSNLESNQSFPFKSEVTPVAFYFLGFRYIFLYVFNCIVSLDLEYEYLIRCMLKFWLFIYKDAELYAELNEYGLYGLSHTVEDISSLS